MRSETGTPAPASRHETGVGVAVLIPCYNEAPTVRGVVESFRHVLPAARVIVFDNASTDGTAAIAQEAGAEVQLSPRRGKGNVLRHMLREVDAELYLTVDGDGTYPAEAAPAMLRRLEEAQADMVVGTRLHGASPGAFPTFHSLGNRVISGLVARLFRAEVTDVLSGYRLMTRSLARSLNIRARGFDIETELTLQTLIRDRQIVEHPIEYGTRPEGSHSKLNTWSDGVLILRLLLLLFKDYKPLLFFGSLGALCCALGLLSGWFPVQDYMEDRFVRHVPLALLAAALEILALLFLGLGLTLDAITRFHLDQQERIDTALARRAREGADG